MGLRGRVPGQLLSSPPRAFACLLECVVVGEELVHGRRETGHIPRGHHAAGGEAADRLGDAADVVRDGGNPGAERAQEGAALVELRPVWEDCDRGVAEGAVDLRLREVAEAPFHLEPVRSRPVRLDRLERIAGDEKPRVAGLADRLDRVAESLVGPDDPEGEHRATVVSPLGLGRKHRMGNDPEPLAVDADRGERVGAALAVDDDPVEPREEAAPEAGAVCSAAGEKIVRREDRRQVRPKEERVELGRRHPLDMQHVGTEPAQRRETERMLRDLEGQAQRRSPEHARRERIEELATRVPERLGRLAETKARRDELHLGTCTRQRLGQLVVVRRGEGRGIGEQDAHGLVRYAVPMLVRTWNLFHGKPSPPGRRAFLLQMIELVTRDRPDVVCLQELPVWALPQLERWSGMHANGAVARRPLLPVGARAVTALHHGLIRSAFEGEADAILTREPARALGVHVVGTTKLRRIAHAVEIAGVTVLNFHIDGDREQFDRLLALAPERAIVAGDANLVAPAAEGFSPPLDGSIDQILVRGLNVSEGPSAWPLERRIVDGRVLSDHAPVEVVVA
jgi:endonuclease/exonuclease/phosphatase family metal-dependent hydrolase